MPSPKIVLWRPMYDTRGHKLLEEGGASVTVVDDPDPKAVMAALPGAKALWVRTPERVTETVLEAASELVVVSTSGFGYDNVDIPAATKRGILVVNHCGFGRVSVSEHSLMMLLAVAKQLRWADAATRDGSGWESRSGIPIFELEGRTVGLLGLGYIGAELARKLTLAFRCRVLAYDPYVDPRIPPLVEVEMQPSLEALLKQSEFFCICAELTDATREMIGAKELAMLPKGAMVVNTARGRILRIDALLDALDSGHIAAAGLDVVYPEPLPPGHRLFQNPKVILTPHTAGMTVETAARVAQSAAEQILAAVSGEMPRFPLNAEAWQRPNARRPRPG